MPVIRRILSFYIQYLFVFIALVFFCVSPAATQESKSFAECSQLLAERSFKSGEEFLQLFSIMYRGDPAGAFKIGPAVLDSLTDVLRTYFPVSRLDSIAYREHRLTLYFDDRQKVCIPGLYRQAYMHFSDKLILDIHADDSDPDMIVFDILDGRVSVTTTWLLKMFTPFALDARGTGLFYRIDKKAKKSVLGMRQDVSAPPESLDVEVVSDKLVKIGARHPDMRDKVDLWFKPGALHYFGFTVKLPEYNYIKCTGYDREYKPEAYDFFKRLISDVLAAPEQACVDGVTKHLVLTYHLEEKRGVFEQEFEFGVIE